VQGVGRDEAPFQRGQRVEQGLQNGDFVALLFEGHLAQRQTEPMAHGREQLQGLALVASAAAHGLVVHGQARQSRDLLCQEQGADDAFKVRGVQFGDDPEKRRVDGRTVAAFFVFSATQRLQLALGQFAALVLESLVAARAHQRRHRRAGQDKGLLMPQAMSTPPVL